MKNWLLLIFTFVFAFNTLSLSALASCPHIQNTIIKKTNVELPPCHQKAQESQNSGHCKGICFCLHAQMSQNILPFSEQPFSIVIEKQDFYISSLLSLSSQAIAPNLRPPILNS